MDDVLDDARAALAWADHGGTSPVAATAMAGMLADVLFQRGHPGEAQRRYQQAALLAAEPGDRCRWLRLAAGAASTRNVGGDTVDLLLQSADTALASGAADDAAHDLAAAAALQYRAPGIIRRPIDVPAVDAQLTQARAISQGGARAEAAIAIAAGWAYGATVRSTELTEQAMQLAGRSDDPLLVVEAFDQLSALELDAGHLDAAEAVIERRLAAITDVPIEPRSGGSPAGRSVSGSELDRDGPRPADLAAGPRDLGAVGEAELGDPRAATPRRRRCSSMRARFEPAQRWMPTPNATWRLTCAVDDDLVGPSNASGSRLAAGKLSSTLSPACIGQPASSVSSLTMRAIVTGE